MLHGRSGTSQMLAPEGWEAQAAVVLRQWPHLRKERSSLGEDVPPGDTRTLCRAGLLTHVENDPAPEQPKTVEGWLAAHPKGWTHAHPTNGPAHCSPTEDRLLCTMQPAASSPKKQRAQPSLFQTQPLQSLLASHAQPFQDWTVSSPSHSSRAAQVANTEGILDQVGQPRGTTEETLQLQHGANTWPTRGGAVSRKKPCSAANPRMRVSWMSGKGNDEVLRKLSSSFHSSTDPVRQGQHAALESVTTWDVIKLARSLNIPIEEVRVVKSVFSRLDDNENGCLEFREFERAAVLLVQEQRMEVSKQCVRALCTAHWSKGDRNKSGTIDFHEFLRWWAENRFREDLLLSAEQRKCRELAKKHGVAEETLEHIKHCYDLFDSDGSGVIDVHEFRQILHCVLRVPPGVELPERRIQCFWRELDRDGSGEADFEEFLPWWLSRCSTLLPYDGFYRRVRCLRLQAPDPPAYPPGRCAAADGQAAAAATSTAAEEVAD
uniref:EF-hand domain-containing protein n=1 Tax=Pyrodinium bahamense TaxID=73915 RepID=A0A7S0FJ41_9DINO